MRAWRETKLYLWIRSVIKTIIHFVTGTSQIERVCRTEDVDALQYSLRSSKVLRNYLQKHSFRNAFSTEQADELIAIKNVHTDHMVQVRKILERLHCFQHALMIVSKLQRQPYNPLSAQHESMLLSIWKNLQPDLPLKSRISEQWIMIGFQASDPATDFRGAGYLGLRNLHAFSQKKKCFQILKVACLKESEYFFASASLFMTITAIEMMKDKVIPVDYWTTDSCMIEDRFQQVYEMVFWEFNKFWLNVADKSMMQLNVNLLNFASVLKKSDATSIKGWLAEVQ